MRGLLHRRQIRIKTLQNFYSYHSHDNMSVNDGVMALMDNMEASYDLYLLLLDSLLELRQVAINEIDKLQLKRIQSEEDKNPNRRFVDNKILRLLDECQDFKVKRESRGISWGVEEGNNFFVKIYQDLKKSEYYQEYITNSKQTWGQDMKFVHRVFKDYLVNNDVLQENLEEQNMCFMDDLDMVAISVLKTVESFKISEGSFNKLMRLYKDEDADIDFAKTLYREAAKNQDLVKELVDKLASNWEWDRIAVMDRLLLQLGIAEAKSFPQIPIKVSLNEYVEIAKEYSTKNSAVFVNGVLDKSLKELQHKGEIVKTGRGLI